MSVAAIIDCNFILEKKKSETLATLAPRYVKVALPSFILEYGVENGRSSVTELNQLQLSLLSQCDERLPLSVKD